MINTGNIELLAKQTFAIVSSHVKAIKFTSFCNAPTRTFGTAAILLALWLGSADKPAQAADLKVFRLQWQESGIHERVTSYRPHPLSLLTEAPKGLKRAPEGLASPRYGIIKLGPPDAPREFIVLSDVAQTNITKLLVDANGNGDLTDDAACVTTNRIYTQPDGATRTSWRGEGNVTFPFAGGTRKGRLIFYGFRLRPATAARGALATLIYYTDYGLVGEVQIEGQTIPAVLDDASAAGYFRLDAHPALSPILWLDVKNPSGRNGLAIPANQSFEVGGKWWAITNLALDGAFSITASTKPVKTESKPEVDLSPGQKAPAFTASLLGGKPVKFPDDYRGKVVLLDFWATWCGPCVAEIPNVVKAYEQYHAQGLEVLGISLDKADWETKLADFTKKKSMPWPQVYEGKFWEAQVARRYGIHSIPHMLLVNGDTCEIIADKDIRGEALAPAIEKALAARNPKANTQ